MSSSNVYLILIGPSERCQPPQCYQPPVSRGVGVAAACSSKSTISTCVMLCLPANVLIGVTHLATPRLPHFLFAGRRERTHAVLSACACADEEFMCVSVWKEGRNRFQFMHQSVSMRLSIFFGFFFFYDNVEGPWLQTSRAFPWY